MGEFVDVGQAQDLAAATAAEIPSLPVRNSPLVLASRRQYSRQLGPATPAFILAVAWELRARYAIIGWPTR